MDRLIYSSSSSTHAPPKKRQRFTNEEKYEMIKMIGNDHLKSIEAASLFHVSKRFITKMLSESNKIKEICELDQLCKKRKIVNLKNNLQPLEDKTIMWIVKMNSTGKGNVVTWRSIIEQATLFKLNFISYPNNTITNEEYEAIKSCHISNGWIERLEKRHKMNSVKLIGYADLVQRGDIQLQMNQILNNIKGVQQHLIFNLDEFGLYFKNGGNRTIQNIHSSKHRKVIDKNRISVVLLVNAAGGKEIMYIIGKSKRPRGVNIEGIKQLGINYLSQLNSWQDEETMGVILDQLNDRAQRANATYYLLMDNCSSHLAAVNKRCIKTSNNGIYYLKHLIVQYFPPNSTAVTQPIDHGLVYMVKSRYSSIRLKDYHEYLMKNEEGNTKSLAQFSSFDNAIHWLHNAWQSVEASSIKKCFEESLFSFGNLNIQERNIDEDVSNRNTNQYNEYGNLIEI